MVENAASPAWCVAKASKAISHSTAAIKPMAWVRQPTVAAGLRASVTEVPSEKKPRLGDEAAEPVEGGEVESGPSPRKEPSGKVIPTLWLRVGVNSLQ